ncbi:hypothetical protein H072_19 [Dactylellina haptotyla CBS 200.50]|uniref:Fatty acid desaturase domain-containing protein n=1 Tax=Dactylellina haptotyla (strain CBS 200.50) TaxID=1284197 RepID=S8ASN0_DACHA|nr:hypothetical protein H072_19 [Dactylellina haptotyla CBS 200.50]
MANMKDLDMLQPTGPKYKIDDLRSAIPQSCFQRSTVRGVYHVTLNILMVVVVFLIFHAYVRPEIVEWKWLRLALWLFYSFLQGLLATGLWILAHECGHQALSPYTLLNDSAGFLLHSMLLVPYFSFKITHARHHSYNAHLYKDVVFVPKKHEEYTRASGLPRKINEAIEDTPVVAAIQLLMMQLVGWPAYLTLNVSGQSRLNWISEASGEHQNGSLNHFNPRSSLFRKKDALWILLSDAGCLITASFLYYLAVRFSWKEVVIWYFVPYLWVNHWIVAITYLQHTDPTMYRYDSSIWNFQLGAATTIDRSIGFIGSWFFYNVVETHVLHHHFPKIPFYHALEATSAIRPVMGLHYKRSENEGLIAFLQSLWLTAKTCLWVEEIDLSEGITGVFSFGNKQKSLEMYMYKIDQ